MDMIHNIRAFHDEITNTKYIYGCLINTFLLKVICSRINNEITGRTIQERVCYIPITVFFPFVSLLSKKI